MGDLARADAYADEILSIAPAGSSPWCSAVGVKMMLGLEAGSEERLASIIATFMGAELTVEDPDLLSRVHCILVFVRPSGARVGGAVSGASFRGAPHSPHRD